jgi:hypothetical protein
MTGALTLSGAPTAALHAATKQYVDNAVVDAKNSIAKPYVITAGTNDITSSTRLPAGYRYDGFDVFPPVGKSMNNLVAFVPSLRTIYIDGAVGPNYLLGCTYLYRSDRIRVYVENIEGRHRLAADWLAIWS